MKQFNLEEYLKNPARKIVTRDGHNARIICTDRKSPTGHNIVVLLDYGSEEISTTCNNNGETEFCSPFQSKGDLFFAPEKKEGWINIYVNNWLDGTIYPSKEEALSMRDGMTEYITTIKIARGNNYDNRRLYKEDRTSYDLGRLKRKGVNN